MATDPEEDKTKMLYAQDAIRQMKEKLRDENKQLSEKLKKTVYYRMRKVNKSSCIIDFWTKPNNTLSFVTTSLSSESIRAQISIVTGLVHFDIKLVGDDD